MKKLLIGLLLICLATAGYAASPVEDFMGILDDDGTLTLSFETKGYELKSRNAAAMRATRARLDKETRSYMSRSLDDLREAMRSEDEKESLYSAWAIIRAYVPDGDLRNWREAAYAHAKDFSDGIPSALVFAEAFYRAETILVRGGALWNARELYEQFIDDSLGQVFYYVAPYSLHLLMYNVSGSTGLLEDPYISPFRVPSPTVLPITMAQPGDDQYDKSSENCIWLNEYGLPTIDDHGAAKFIWDTTTGKVHKL